METLDQTLKDDYIEFGNPKNQKNCLTQQMFD